MWPNPQETSDLVTFTEELLHGKLHFLCSERNILGTLLIALNGRKTLTALTELKNSPSPYANSNVLKRNLNAWLLSLVAWVFPERFSHKALLCQV